MNRKELYVHHASLHGYLPVLILTMTCSVVHAADDAGFQNLAVADTQELDSLRGMNADTRISVESSQELNATVTGSSFSAGTINGGSVTFAEHSLDNFSGIGLFNIVTGNNNAVDSAVGVTFNLQ